MRSFFTLFIFLLTYHFGFSQQPDSLLQKGLTGKVKGLNIQAVNQGVSEKENTRIVIRCGSTVTSDDKPLFVIDGIPADLKLLSELNPNDIDSIWILKNAEASAIYGSAGVNGVIILKTKSPKLREFVVKDFLTGEVVPSATVKFIRQSPGNDSITCVADENGIISTNKLVIGGIYTIKVSSVGYKTLSENFNSGWMNRKAELLMEREKTDCLPVILTSSYCYRRKISCGFTSTKVSICSMTMYSDTVSSGKANTLEFSSAINTNVYPNPMRRGQTLTIQTLSDQNSALQIVLTDLSGKRLLQQNLNATKGVNRVTINTDPRWAVGVYLLSLKNEKGILIKTEKVVVN